MTEDIFSEYKKKCSSSSFNFRASYALYEESWNYSPDDDTYRDRILILLESKADPNVHDNNYQNPLLILTSSASKYPVIRNLITSTNIDDQDIEGYTPFLVTCSSYLGDNKVFNHLFRLSNIHARLKNGKTALMLSVKVGNLFFVKKLLNQYDVNVDDIDNCGNNVLNYINDKKCKFRHNDNFLLPFLLYFFFGHGTSSFAEKQRSHKAHYLNMLEKILDNKLCGDMSTIILPMLVGRCSVW